MMYSPIVHVVLPTFRRSMERNHAADICEYLVTTVQPIWEILDEKDTPRVFSRPEFDILLDHLRT